MSPIRPMRPISPIGPIALIMLLAFTGCSGDPEVLPQEPVVEQLVPITLGGNLQDEQAVTRSTPLSALATTFNAWCYKNMTHTDQDGYTAAGLQLVMPGYTVSWQSGSANTTTTNTHGWDYTNGDQTIKYWDYSALAYRFFGATNWGGETSETHDPNKTYGTHKTLGAQQSYEIATLVDATAQTSAPYVSKLWYSTGNLADYPDRQFGKAVQMVFVKPFVQARFMFTFTSTDAEANITLTGKSFKPTDNTKKIYRKGTVTMSYPLTGTDTHESFTLSGTSNDDATTLEAMTVNYTDTDPHWYDLLPANDQGTYTLQVTVNGTPKTAVVPAEYMNWLPGYQYTYIFKVNDDGSVEIGSVQAAFANWVEASKDHSIYNW